MIYVQMPVGKSKMVVMRPEIILEIVCEHYNISLERIQLRSRKEEICLPRQLCMYLLKQYTTLTLNQIGSMFNDGFDHSTVLHSIKSVQDRIDTYERFRKRFKIIEQRVLLSASRSDNVYTELPAALNSGILNT